MTMEHEMARRLEDGLLQGRRRAGDRLVLDDATLRAALDGSRPLTRGERAALQDSPLTARRLRHLALERRAAAAAGAAVPGWRGSRGMLRAASSGAAQALTLATDDGWWTLHLVGAGTAGGAWRAILQLAPQAPFAAGLIDAQAPLRVLDGAGATLLEGRLDTDGECEAPWPFALA
uniref:hypothetical protein n=1 Tax=uncultured Massilia sp. TaxID=169973 RepID=UPI0025F60491